MDNSERNEHFQGFAKLLWQRLQAEIEYGPHHGNLAMQKPALETLIAQRAYNLVYSSLDVESVKLVGMTPEEVIHKHSEIRDTHFQGFAETLWDTLHTLYLHETGQETYEQVDKLLIAQFLYDFACHCMDETVAIGSTTENFVKDIPDLPICPTPLEPSPEQFSE